MSGLTLPVLPPFECNTDYNTITFRWKRWLDKLDNLLIGLNITDEVQKRALLRHYVGDEVDDIFITLPNTGSDYASAKSALNLHFGAQHNVEFEVYKFRQIKQLPHETLDQYVTRLKRTAISCDFADDERELKSQVILGCLSNKLRRHALQVHAITLAELLSYGRATETAEKHAGAIEGITKEQINSLEMRENPFKTDKANKKDPPYPQPPKKSLNANKKSTNPRKPCKFCGKNWHPDGLQQCRAQGKTCNKCGKQNHFATVCLSKTDNDQQHKSYNKQTRQHVHYQSPTRSDEQTYRYEQSNDYVLASEQGKGDDMSRYETALLKINQVTLELIIDSGATVNVMNMKDFNKVNPRPTIHNETNPIYGYGHKRMNTIGQTTLSVQHRNKHYNLTFVITKEIGPSILGKDSAKLLGVITFVNNIEQPNGEYELASKHEQLFKGIGKITNVTIVLNVDPTVKPVIQKLRRVPFHLRQKVEEELTELIRADIIEPVPTNEPTPWVSPIVTIPKKQDPNHVRICVDMKKANEAILRERFITPTIEDVMYQLNGAQHFTCLDLAKGYHQLELHQDSRAITTFVTHQGLFRYKRLHFGVNTAAEVFQNEIRKLLQGINNTINVSDDILVYGRTQQEHDLACQLTLERLESRGVTLNKDKCRFNKTTLKFLGYIFSKEGIKTDPAKIQAIHKLSAPTTPKDVRSLLGMVTFCSRFIPHLALTAKPLRDLTKQNVKFEWKTEHQQAFKTIKEQMIEGTNLAYFDTSRKTQIWTDASPIGVGAILAQVANNKTYIVAFASHALSETEKRYSQIEKEALALTYATKHFHLYVYGHPFTIITDHKPLIYLFNNSNNILSSRLERWKLKLQPYDYNVDYKSGKRNPADYLSRHIEQDGVATSTTPTSLIAEYYTNFLSDQAIPRTLSAEDIKHHTTEDPTLKRVIQNLVADQWNLKAGHNINLTHLTALHKIKQELSTNTEGNILLRGTRLVLPTTLQHTVIKLAHIGHQGIVKTKALLKEKIWFPGMDAQAEREVRKCLLCNAATPQHATSPVSTTPLPLNPWESLNIDHKGPLPTGEYLLVLIDQYSRFPIVEVIKTTSAKANIARLDQVFATFGIPVNITTDNGSPFNAYEFKQFCNRLGIKHHKIIPNWPRANGSVERFNGTLSKILKIGFTDHNNWKQHMYDLLRSYRATPQSSTERTPAELFFGRKLKTQIPDARMMEKPIDEDILRKIDNIKKAKYKDYHDKRHKLIKTMMQPGDRVLVKQKQFSKTTTPFDPKPYTVTRTKDTLVTANRSDKQITRHRSFFKLLPEDSNHKNELVPPETSKHGTDIPVSYSHKSQKNGNKEQPLADPSRVDEQRPAEVESHIQRSTQPSGVDNQTQPTERNASPRDGNQLADTEKTTTEPAQRRSESKYNLRGKTSPPKRLITEC